MNFLKYFSQFILVSLYFKNCVLQQCIVEYNIDYQGLSIAPNPTTFTSTPDLCCYSCWILPSCQAWSYVASTKACYLKSSIGQKIAVKDISNFFRSVINFC